MKGRVEGIWQNKDRRGRDFWILDVAGEQYSVWDRKFIQDLVQGDEIELLWTEAGRYKNVTKIVRLGTQPNGHAPPPTPIPSVDPKSLQIIRMSCLRSAADLLARSSLIPETKKQRTLEIAKDFEEYVLGR